MPHAASPEAPRVSSRRKRPSLDENFQHALCVSMGDKICVTGLLCANLTIRPWPVHHGLAWLVGLAACRIDFISQCRRCVPQALRRVRAVQLYHSLAPMAALLVAQRVRLTAPRGCAQLRIWCCLPKWKWSASPQCNASKQRRWPEEWPSLEAGSVVARLANPVLLRALPKGSGASGDR